MSFDFDTIIDRRNDDSDKWRAYAPDVLPMWIADMDFKAPQVVIDALADRIKHGVFGYGQSRPPDVIQAIQRRMQREYGWDVSDEAIVFLPGLVCGLNVSARMIALLDAQASIMTTTPVYPPFLAAPVNQGLTTLEVPLKFTQRQQFLHYEMDIAAMSQAARSDTRAFILCQPHNPSGRIFDRTELMALAALAKQSQWIVISDEIHAELVLGQGQHIPYALLDEHTRQHTVTLFAPSKTFNIAGLGASFAIIENPNLRSQFQRAAQGLVPTPNYLAMEAMKVAFNEGDAWLKALRAYLTINRDEAIQQLSHIEGLRMTQPEASFLLWLDFRDTAIGAQPFEHLLTRGLALNKGLNFGRGYGSFVRLNFGCPRCVLQEGIARIFNALTLK